MYIIIIGGGGVGYELARSLSEKDQDVVVIEKNPELARKFSETLDVMVIEENGASPATLEKAKVKSADMVIAVTEVDEINIIACMLAKKYGVPITVGRVRNSDYFKGQPVLTQEQLGLDIVIQPERVAAQEISKILHFPDATDIEYFHRGKVMMLGLVVQKGLEIAAKPLSSLSLPPGCIVVGINRPGGRFVIPGGQDMIEPGDKIYLLGSAPVLKDISLFLHQAQTRVHRIAILGGSAIGLELARLLEQSRSPFTVTLVEKCADRCHHLCRELSHTLVLQGDPVDFSFFKQEELDQADTIVAVTGNDHTNILIAVLARQLGVKKIIAEAMSPQYVPVYNALGIDSVINPRLVTASQILRFTRREDVVALSILKDEKAEVMELVVPESARVANRKITEAGFPRGMLIGSIVRQGEVFVPHGGTVLLPHDHLIIFTLPESSKALERFFSAAGEDRLQQNRRKLLNHKANAIT